MLITYKHIYIYKAAQVHRKDHVRQKKRDALNSNHTITMEEKEASHTSPCPTLVANMHEETIACVVFNIIPKEILTPVIHLHQNLLAVRR